MLKRTQSETEIKVELIRFVGQHPRSMDTLAGISAFWAPTADLKALTRVVRTWTAAGLLKVRRVGGREHFAVTEDLLALANRHIHRIDTP